MRSKVSFPNGAVAKLHYIKSRSNARVDRSGHAFHMTAMNTSFFGELLQSIAERGRSLIERTRERRPAGEARTATFVELCEALLSGRGEASGVALAREILTAYSKLRTGERIAFFE